MGINKATAYRYLVAIRDMGMVEYEVGSIMTEKIRKVNTAQVGMSIAGTIPCSVIGKGEFFVLRASGDSMMEARIDDGDLVIVRKQTDVPTGKIVAALVDGDSTLRRLCCDKEKNGRYLHPENSKADYPDTHGNGFSIQGVAVYALKALE